MTNREEQNLLRDISVWKEIVYRLNAVAVLRDPEKFAHTIYLLMKKYPDNLFFNEKYKNFLTKAEKNCVDIFGWEEAEVHQAFYILSILTQYSKKKT